MHSVTCRDRHCPKCQASAAHRWLEARQADLLPIEYFHVVFTLPAPVSAIAWYNKRIIYGLLLDIAADTLRTIAADPKHLGARIGATLVLHTWGSALTHHPHVHGIVPGGGLSADGERWIACRPGFFLPVRVLSRLFRRRFLDALEVAHRHGQLQFFGEYTGLADPATFARWLAPLRTCEWVVYATRPFAGPKAVLEYLSRYTHRVAISNQRLVAFDERGVTFRWKDYRAKGRTRYKTMTLEAGEFMRRFLYERVPFATVFLCSDRQDGLRLYIRPCCSRYCCLRASMKYADSHLIPCTSLKLDGAFRFSESRSYLVCHHTRLLRNLSTFTLC
ncbi:hypothetical protein QFZ97_006785 [Paraburkholderia youngii]